MKTEMDALGMDERERWCWLLANRGTLIFVGICWLGMIGYEFSQDHTPWFLIAMVPVFAATRFLLYLYYRRTT